MKVTTVLLATAAVAVAVAAADAAATGLRSRLTTPHKRRGDPFARLKRQRASRGIYARHAKREGSGEEGGVKAEPNKITGNSAVSREDTANKKEEKQLRKEEPVEAVEEAAESEPKDGYIQVDQLHGRTGAFQIREEGQGYRNTDAKDEKKTLQHVDDVNTFTSEVHEYQYYPYESFGKQVLVVEPIVSTSQSHYAVPHEVLQPGYGPLRSVSRVPVNLPRYRYTELHLPRYQSGTEEAAVEEASGDETEAASDEQHVVKKESDSSEEEAGAQYSGGEHQSYPLKFQPPAQYNIAGVPQYHNVAGSHPGEFGFGLGPGYYTAGVWHGPPDFFTRGQPSSDPPTSVGDATLVLESSAGGAVQAGEESTSEVQSPESAQQTNNNATAAHTSDSNSNKIQRRHHTVQVAGTFQGPGRYPHQDFNRGAPFYSGHPDYLQGPYRPQRSAVPPIDTRHVYYNGRVGSAAGARWSPGRVVAAAAAGRDLVASGSHQSPIVHGRDLVASGSHQSPVVQGRDLVASGSHHSPVVHANGYGAQYVRQGNIPGYYVNCVRRSHGPPVVNLVPFSP